MRTAALPITVTVIVLACIGSLTALVWVGKVNGDALVGIVSAVIGALLHAAGTRGGVKAVTDPPPDV